MTENKVKEYLDAVKKDLEKLFPELKNTKVTLRLLLTGDILLEETETGKCTIIRELHRGIYSITPQPPRKKHNMVI